MKEDLFARIPPVVWMNSRSVWTIPLKYTPLRHPWSSATSSLFVSRSPSVSRNADNSPPHGKVKYSRRRSAALLPLPIFLLGIPPRNQFRNFLMRPGFATLPAENSSNFKRAMSPTDHPETFSPSPAGLCAPPPRVACFSYRLFAHSHRCFFHSFRRHSFRTIDPVTIGFRH